MTNEEVEVMEDFRSRFREEKVPKFYNGILHLLINLFLLLGMIIGSFYRIEHFSWSSFLGLFAISYIVGNLVVFLVHKYLLHRVVPGFKIAYKIHSKWHHRFYTHEYPIPGSSKDFFILFFPISVVLGFGLIVLPLMYLGFGKILGVDQALYIMGFSALYFLSYEIVHFCSHLPKGHFVLRFPLFKFMREHHLDHHNPRLMHTYNFNIVYPFFDFIFRTYYRRNLNR